MRISIIYFSPTNNTAQIANIIKEKLTELDADIDVHDINITSYSQREKSINFQDYDLLFFGFPIYAQRIPTIIRAWIQTLDGKNKPCSVFFTYGGVTSGVSHYDTKKRLEQQNFQLISTAEFLGKHTFNLAGWDMMVNRPNEDDFSVAREYAIKTLEKYQNPIKTSLEFEEPKLTERQLDRIDKVPKGGVQPPSRKGKECSMCLKCETECPTNAMDANTGDANGDKCIRCLRCVSICPDKVLEINDMRPALAILVKSDIASVEKVSKYFL